MMKLLAVLALAATLATALVTPSKPVFGTLDESEGGWKACDPSVKQWSGYFDINQTTDKHYFYWAFEARSKKSDAPVLMWLTGGPGCSSTLALLEENGPCSVNLTTGDLSSNPYSWNNEAAVVFVDQPAGVGYSYSNSNGFDHNEAEVSNDLYAFVQALLKAHPDWVHRPFFVSGESYGGHYAPATAYRIFQGNQNKEGTHVNLTGLTIGNGLVDPYIQYQYYADLAYNWCKTELGSPCVSESTYQSMTSSIPSCIALIKGCTGGSSFDCELARWTCNSQLSDFQQTGKNVYNIKEQCNDPPLCYDFDHVTKFLNRADVQKALGVRTTQWTSCNLQVNQDFSNDWFQQFATVIPPMMAGGVRVLVYNGDLDFICNWIGGKHWALALDWDGKAKFNNATDMTWTVADTPGAKVRSVAGDKTPILFTFMQVHQAGHMVPMDQPKSASVMINTFMANKAFV